VRITREVLAKAEPAASHEFVSGERRVALTRVFLKMTCPDIDQSIRRKLAGLILLLMDNHGKLLQQRITDAQIVEMVWRNSQCVHNQTGRCPLLVFGKQLADEINDFFAEEERPQLQE
jgi:hypothetical protein